MDLTGIGAISSVIEKGLDIIFPDPAVAAQAKIELLKVDNQMKLSALADETARLTAQIEVNKVEAASTNVWTSGWRPLFGWICGAVIFSQFILAPYLPWCMEVFGFHAPPIPHIDMDMLWPLIMGMMGLSYNRSQDKAKGVAS